VLEGARGVLQKARPMLILESWPGTPQRLDLFALLTEYRYSLHALRFATPPSTTLRSGAFVASSATNFAAIYSSKALANIRAALGFLPFALCC
jgi:hypothetical protein